MKNIANKQFFQCVVLWLLLMLVEPMFEQLCLVVHNFIFYHIAGLSFSSVSLGSMAGFLAGFGYYAAYWLNLPIAILWGLLLLVPLVVNTRLSCLQASVAAWIILLLILGLIIGFNYHKLHLACWQMWVSIGLSSLYWWLSTSLSWLVISLLGLWLQRR